MTEHTIPNIDLYDDRVLVVPLDSGIERTRSGLYAPDLQDKHYKKYTVLLVGPGSKDYPRDLLDLHQGDVVLMRPKMAEPVRINGETYYMARFGHVVARVLEEHKAYRVADWVATKKAARAVSNVTGLTLDKAEDLLNAYPTFSAEDVSADQIADLKDAGILLEPVE